MFQYDSPLIRSLSVICDVPCRFPKCSSSPPVPPGSISLSDSVPCCPPGSPRPLFQDRLAPTAFSTPVLRLVVRLSRDPVRQVPSLLRRLDDAPAGNRSHPASVHLLPGLQVMVGPLAWLYPRSDSPRRLEAITRHWGPPLTVVYRDQWRGFSQATSSRPQRPPSPFRPGPSSNVHRAVVSAGRRGPSLFFPFPFFSPTAITASMHRARSHQRSAHPIPSALIQVSGAPVEGPLWVVPPGGVKSSTRARPRSGVPDVSAGPGWRPSVFSPSLDLMGRETLSPACWWQRSAPSIPWYFRLLFPGISSSRGRRRQSGSVFVGGPARELSKEWTSPCGR